ncbi:lycopene cyclase family protein [Rhodococcus olei]|uniref:Lycopene cyclase family protein n=1 Tax=Rhodococcus olei TaxID=2161675 RepID=A0ABP8NTC2_9NOCA
MSDGGVPDLAVVGLGPAGRALAHRAAAAGLDVVAVDPAPARRWAPTYATWVDEVPPWLGDRVLAARVPGPTVWTRQPRTVDREYAVFDNTALRARLDLAGVRVVTGRARQVTGRTVALGAGAVVRARTVVDARGLPVGSALAEQTAFGLIVPRDVAAPALGGAAALFMDWRRDNGAGPHQAPSFLYAVPVDDGRVLLEETCLVGRPALSLPALRERLLARLSARGVQVPGDAVVERVRFPIEAPRRRHGPLAFGARGGLAHPGTGYSVAASLSAADAVVDALCDGRDPRDALWPRSARVVRTLRGIGLRALLALPPARVDGFFDDFFALPAPLQRAYLSDRSDPAGVAAAMWTLFRHAPMPVRRTLIGAALHPGRGHR